MQEAIEIVRVRHASGGTSQLTFKSYEQKRAGFEGTEIQNIWLDEEAPLDIYIECLLRTMTCNGLVMLTFTPLEGLTDTILQFLPEARVPEIHDKRFIVNITWDDVPHLSEADKAEMLEGIPEYQRDARTKGIPQLGSGIIYPIAEEDFKIQPIKIQPFWPRAYALDVGWNKTAALWGAWDRDSDTVYLYSCHYMGKAEPSIHADAIRSRGAWIPGLIDPAARGRSQIDGRKLINMYRELGLKLQAANNAVEAGIYEVWQRLSTGRLKVFDTLKPFFEEYRLYRRDKDGKVVKNNDHLMDDCRYLCAGLTSFIVEPKYTPDQNDYNFEGSWMM